MACARSVTYSVLINGTLVIHITSSRGIRQGDPLSPYLFLFCIEGLTSLLNTVIIENQLHGIPICRGAPCISHLLFVDDCILFLWATPAEVFVISAILQQYEFLSRQKNNFHKFKVVFSAHVDDSLKYSLATILGVYMVYTKSVSWFAYTDWIE